MFLPQRKNYSLQSGARYNQTRVILSKVVLCLRQMKRYNTEAFGCGKGNCCVLHYIMNSCRTWETILFGKWSSFLGANYEWGIYDNCFNAMLFFKGSIKHMVVFAVAKIEKTFALWNLELEDGHYYFDIMWIFLFHLNFSAKYRKMLVPRAMSTNSKHHQRGISLVFSSKVSCFGEYLSIF